MSDLAVRVENLAKQYRIGGPQAGYRTFRETLLHSFAAPVRWARREQRVSNIFWALNNISFEVKQGDTVGIVGRNGAGKSTLLKILSRITKPTKGRIELRGRVSSLLEVGTGFHSELSGRDNIYLNGAILGMNRAEINRKFDEIVDFSEVEKFLDTPVKHYSSGMYVRLAFAVAAYLEPEILIVDEVLAVGDIEFQKKCLGKMGDVAKEGRTVLFVSHNLGAIRALCVQGIWLDGGQILKTGSANEVLKAYEERITGFSTQSSQVMERNLHDIKDSKLHFRTVEIRNTDGQYSGDFKYGESLVLNVRLAGQLPGGVFSPEFRIYNELGILVSVGASGPHHGEYFSSKVNEISIEIGPLTITSGKYRLSLSMMAGYERIDTWDNATAFTITECQPFQTSWEIRSHAEGVCILQHSFRAIE